jgi:Transmembrane domain of unknown function (DUF3566)
MTERSAEQASVETRPTGQDSHQDTTRIPLAERLQRRIAAADERRSSTQAPRESQRVLPPMPAELRPDPRATASAPAAAPAAQPDSRPRAVQPVPEPLSEQTAQTPVTPARPTATARRTPAPSRAPRRARLRLSRIDPWSVMKLSFLLSIAFGIVTVVSVFLVWSVLGAAGVWSSINNTVSDTVSSGNNVSTFNIEDYLGMSRVLGFTMLVSVIDVILITAIATLGAFLYNMAASLLGGIEVTLAEDN